MRAKPVNHKQFRAGKTINTAAVKTISAGNRPRAQLIASSPQCSGRQRTRSWIVCGLLCLAVGLVFGQTVGFEFINLDDGEYVYSNPHAMPGLTLHGIAWAFTDGHFDWYPLSAVSHMLDCQFYGIEPGGHHLTNVLLHAATAILLLLALVRMTGDFWPSAFAAAAFAIHPLRVESVAWVAERKDVLSGLFFMLTLLAYADYARRPFSPARYLLVMALFALGLMSKAMLVTLPFVLLLLDYWPLGRLEARGLRLEEAGRTRSGLRPPSSSLKPQASSLLAEKIPLALLSIVACAVTLLTQNPASPMIDRIPFPTRIANALVSYVAYIGQLFYPVRLAQFNTIEVDNLSTERVLGALLVLSAITVCAFRYRRRCPYFFVGWLWYLATLLPVIGLVQVGTHGMADRYTYLTQIGLTVALAWAAADLVASWSHRRLVLSVGSGLILAALMACAWRQTSYWRDSDTLWARTLACASDKALAHGNLGDILTSQGKIDEAAIHYHTALEIDPHSALAHNNLATVLGMQGNIDQAVAHYRKALEIRPKFAGAQYNLGCALAAQGKIDEAIGHYQQSLEIQPDFAGTHNNLGLAVARQGRIDEAIVHYRRALKIRPRYAEAHDNLAALLAWQGKVDEAIVHDEQALKIDPTFAPARDRLARLRVAPGNIGQPNAPGRETLAIEPQDSKDHVKLGVALYSQGKTSQAISHWREAIRSQPDQPGALYRLAWALATSPDESIRNGGQAVELAGRAVQISGGREPAMLDALAAAYAETGEFSTAVQIAEKGLSLADAQNNNALADALVQRIDRYRSGSPYRAAR